MKGKSRGDDRFYAGTFYGENAGLFKKKSQKQTRKTAEHFLTGLFHKKLSGLWLKFARIPKEKEWEL